MSDNPIKFPGSESSSEDDLSCHQCSEEDDSSNDWRASDYSLPWSSEKEDLEEEDEDEDDDEEEGDDSSDSTPTSTHLLPSEQGEHDPLALTERITFRLRSL